MNLRLARELASCVSQRRSARLFRLNLKTVARKVLFLAEQARNGRLSYLRGLENSGTLLTELQFDEMETFERSKCLPLSIPLAVHPKTRRILSFRVASMPAKGPLASISLKKYGPRADDREACAKAVLSEIKGCMDPQAEFTTDQNPKYPSWIRADFPKFEHKTVKGRRGCIAGQGELKKIGFDPLFSLNHTAAMIRANVNRLVRRTWCTTKRPDRLLAHLEIYAWYHNTVLIHGK